MHHVWRLMAAQALAGAGSFLLILLGGILGAALAPTPALATLPISMMVVGVAAGTLPAGKLMARYGRRPVFVGSSLFAAGASLLAAVAVVQASFAVFTLAVAMLGLNTSVVMQYRFAAVELAPADKASQAISTVMIGALVAAVLGPEIGVRAADLWEGSRYAGSFVAGAACFVGSAVLLAGLPAQAASTGRLHEGSRPLAEIAAQPDFRVAVLGSVVAYAVMSFIMTATPISMHVHDAHSEQATKFVIQSHLLAMYLPSLVSGRIVAGLGIRLTMVIGTVLMTACVAVALFGGREVMHYWWSMVLLGAGWNLLFVAGTTLLTTTYRSEERFRVQATNDFVTFATQAVASLLAGAALSELGWRLLNLSSVPLLVAMLWAAVAMNRRTAQ